MLFHQSLHHCSWCSWCFETITVVSALNGQVGCLAHGIYAIRWKVCVWGWACLHHHIRLSSFRPTQKMLRVRPHQRSNDELIPRKEGLFLRSKSPSTTLHAKWPLNTPKPTFWEGLLCMFISPAGKWKDLLRIEVIVVDGEWFSEPVLNPANLRIPNRRSVYGSQGASASRPVKLHVCTCRGGRGNERRWEDGFFGKTQNSHQILAESGAHLPKPQRTAEMRTKAGPSSSRPWLSQPQGLRQRQAGQHQLVPLLGAYGAAVHRCGLGLPDRGSAGASDVTSSCGVQFEQRGDGWTGPHPEGGVTQVTPRSLLWLFTWEAVSWHSAWDSK